VLHPGYGPAAGRNGALQEAPVPNRFDEEKDKRIDAAREILASDPDGEALVGFADILFKHAAGEDLIEYDADVLAGVSRDAFAFFRQRGEPVAVRIAEVPATDLKGRSHSVINISTANRPFIFDSVLGELQAAGHSVRLIVHPVLEVRRDAAGEATSFAGAGATTVAEATRESFIHIHVPPIREPGREAELGEKLQSLLSEVRQATEDWAAMRARVREAIAEFRDRHPGLPDDAVAETVAFLEWVEADNFVFLGTRDFSYAGLDAAGIEAAQGEGLGLLRDPSVRVLRRGQELVAVTPEVRAFLTAPEPLIVTKANVKSRVHRRDYMDYIGLKRFENGAVNGELRIVGLFTSEAFTRFTQGIPLIGPKVARLVARAGFDPLGHSGKTLLNILEHYPRTELFQASEDELFEAAMAILQLEERPRVRALARRDRFDRFVSVLVFVPRDRYTSDLRERIGQALAELYEARVSAFFPDFSAAHLARVQFILGRNAGPGPEPTQGDVEARIRAILRTFDDDLADVLAMAFPPDRAAELARTYAESFDAQYRAAFSANEAIADIAVAEHLGTHSIAAQFGHLPGTPDGEVALRLHHLGDPLPLSQRVPLLEHLGFAVVDERTYCIARQGGENLFLHDMTLNVREGIDFDPQAAGRLRDTLLAVWADQAENDGFNALVLAAGLQWREAALLRTIGRYLRQTNVPYSIDYLWGALTRNPAIAALLVMRFALRFGPNIEGRDHAEAEADAALEVALQAVASLDDDTILRAYRNVITAAVRTDFYTAGNGEHPSAITLKLAPGALPFVPLPRPFREIFVHSPEVDGLHIRFGPVARGGLRWSDRPQDFRTEVLGLVKAQQVKNAVIVPVGAKGGFVPARLPPPAGPGGREAVFQAGRAAYIRFVERLLSVTDDIGDEAIVPPAGLIRHDGDDPYLVVAADKGTATFSDTANAISLERGFWLGDAFASGGSAGYDHKAMGITARGAWEAVKRHFREMDIDIQTAPFTVVGVGDMSGDVFGNGMLLSPCIKLVAAFDHRDIFIDPEPDPARSLEERRRLFNLPRSSWADYDRSLLSAGGGIYARSEKQIKLSPQACVAVGIANADLTPAELMAAILRAPADLLWFGGIGTYVRGPDETDAEVGDKANDAIRINAADIGARVVGEGANLGMTQQARIAYGLKGGRCNSDAVDNSAGVNTSDVEVNIKIALAPAVRSGRLTPEERLELLGAMTDDVAALVLRNNYQQTLAISLEERRGVDNLANQMRLMAELEERGLLDRSVEDLPQNTELETRAAAGQGLTRAEIGTLLAFAKIALTEDIVASSVPDDPYLAQELLRYFPEPMRERFATDIESHRLRREIIGLQLANSLINRGGPTLLVAVRDRTGATVADLTRAYAATRDSFSLRELHGEIEALDAKIPGQLQLELFSIVQDVLVDRLGWFIRYIDPAAGLAGIIDHVRGSLAELSGALDGDRAGAEVAARREVAERLSAGGVPQSLAASLALLPALARAADIVFLADRAGRPLADAEVAYSAVGGRFCFARLDAMINQIATVDYYDNLALQKARDSLETAQRDLARAVLDRGGNPSDIAAWEKEAGGRIATTVEQVEKILADRKPSTAKATVAASLLADLARGYSLDSG
jgi:glutamate dehydrogenase